MPFEEDDQIVSPALPALRFGKPGAPQGSVPGAAFRLENMVGSALVSESLHAPRRVDPDYDVLGDIEGTRYEAHKGRFAGVFNSEHAQALKADIDRETRDREVLDASGATGMLWSGAAAVLDPTVVIPGGAVVKSTRAGQALGRSAASVGAAAGVATAVQEAGLHATQQTRTLEESALNIGGSVVLGAILGGGAGAFTRSALKSTAAKVDGMRAATDVTDEEFAEIALGSVGAARADLTSQVAQRLRETLKREPTPQEIDVEVDNASRLVGEAIIKRIPLVSIQDPLIRGVTSDARAMRESTLRLAESPLDFQGSRFGETVAPGGSVEGRIRLSQRALDKTLSAMDRHYAEYFFDGQRKVAGETRAVIQGAVAPGGKMSAKEFREAVGRAMLNGDQHENPAVAAAAREYRKTLLGPTTEAAQEVGLLPKNLNERDMHGETYAPSVYRTQEVVGRRGEFTQMLESHLLKSRGRANDKMALSRDLPLAEGEYDKALQESRELRANLRGAKAKAKGQVDRSLKSIGKDNAALTELGRASFRLFRRGRAAEAAKITPQDKIDAKEVISFVRSAREPMSLLDAIRDRGGVSVSDELQAVMDNPRVAYRRNGKLVFPGGAIAARDGLSMDDMRGILADEGYIDPASSVNDFMDLIRENANGRKTYSVDAADEVFVFEQAQAFRADLDEAGVNLNIDEIVDFIRRQDGKPVGEAIEAAKKEADLAIKGDAEIRRVRDSIIDRMEQAAKGLDEARARLDDIEANIEPRMKERLAEADARTAAARKSLRKAKDEQASLDEFANLSDAEVREIIEEITDTITGVPEGRMMTGESFIKAGDVGPRGALRERTLNFVPRSALADAGFLELDAELVARHYMRTVPVDTEFVRAFGSTDMAGEIDGIKSEYRQKINAIKGVGAKSERARQKLHAQEKRDLRDLEGMRDRIRGLYAIPDNPDAFLVRTGRALRAFNYIRLLGGMTISAVPDMGKIIMSEGAVNTARGMASMVGNFKRFRLAAEEVKDAGTALDMTLGTRAMAWADVTDRFSDRTVFERGLSSASSRFGLVALMNPWNAGLKQFTGALAMTRVIKIARKMADGTATPDEIGRMTQAGLTKTHAAKIVEQIKRHGDMDGEFILPRGGEWDANARDALDAFRVAIGRDVDRAVVTPGQDKPLFMSTEMGAIVGQFRSFAFSTVQRTMLAGLQQRDAAALNGFLSMFALGAMAYYLKETNAGRDVSDDPATIAVNAFDRSGVVGWLMDANNIAEKVTGGAVGMSAITGEQVSRFQSRNAMGAVLGPTFGLVEDAIQTSSAAGRGDFSEHDLRRLRYMVPGQNLFYLRSMIDRLEEAVANAGGLK